MSGVGLNHDPNGSFYVVPFCYDARWDDEGYQFPAENELSMMVQFPDEGRHGFILHAVCYSLLQRFFQPEPVPVARLLEICKSCPFQYLGLSWDHDYGGIVRLKNTYPWDQDLDPLEQPKLHRYRQADPWNIPELKEHLQRTQLGMPKRRRVNSTKLNLIDGLGSNCVTRRGVKSTKLNLIDGAVSNCFTRLPLEVLGHIVTYLPTDEVRTLDRTSKGLAKIIPSVLGPSFWASRFYPPFELDFVFEAQEYKGELDWRSLYFRMGKALHRSRGLRNRKRIWGLIRSPLSELACMHWTGSLALRPLDGHEVKLTWKEMHGDLQPLQHRVGTSGFVTGCKRFHTQRTSIPTLLRQVAVCTISIGNATYVTGLRFIPNEGLEVCLGYTVEGKGSSLTEQFMDTTGVQGFILAIGLRGVRALQFISCTGQLSKWVGCPKDLPITRRLATSQSITMLEAGFDVSATSFHIVTNSLIRCARDSKWLAWQLQRHSRVQQIKQSPYEIAPCGIQISRKAVCT